MSRSTPKPLPKFKGKKQVFEAISRKTAALMLRSARNDAYRCDIKFEVDRNISGRRTYVQTSMGGRGVLVCESPNASLIHKRPTTVKPARAAAAHGVSATSTMQELADGQRRRIAQGLSYGYALEDAITPAQVLALMQIKDTLRRVGMAIVVDGATGCVMFIKREVADQRTLAYSTFV